MKNGRMKKNENISSKSDDFAVFCHFTTRNFAFYVVFDVADFLSTFNFSISRKNEIYKKISNVKNNVKRKISRCKTIKTAKSSLLDEIFSFFFHSAVFHLAVL